MECTDKVVVGINDKQLVALECFERFDGCGCKLVGRNSVRRGRHNVAHYDVSNVAHALNQTAQVPFGEDTNNAVV